jgi:putative flippase GtrA
MMGTDKSIRHLFELEIVKYVCVGGGAVLIDFISYMIMIERLDMNHSVSKGISYILGALFAFAINKLWTFESKRKTHEAFIRFALLYASTFTANVLINATFLWIGFVPVIGFAFATVTSVVLNYVGQKYWVFKGEN